MAAGPLVPMPVTLLLTEPSSKMMACVAASQPLGRSSVVMDVAPLLADWHCGEGNQTAVALEKVRLLAQKAGAPSPLVLA